MLNPWLEKIREKEQEKEKKKKEEESRRVRDLYDEMAEIWDAVGFSQCLGFTYWLR